MHVFLPVEPVQLLPLLIYVFLCISLTQRQFDIDCIYSKERSYYCFPSGRTCARHTSKS